MEVGTRSPVTYALSSTRASAPTPRLKRRRVRWPHTQRARPTIHVAGTSAPSTRLRRSALLRARLSPPHGPHAALARTIAASQATPSFLVPRPFGRSPSAGTLMSESLIPHTHRRPPICAHICALLAHAWVPAMIACAARLPMSRTAPRSPHCASPLPGDWGIPTPAQAHPQSTGRTGALSSRRSRRRHSRGPCPPPYPRPASARRT